MVAIVLAVGCLVEFVNAGFGHWWHTTNDDLAVLMLGVSAMLLQALYRPNNRPR